MYAIIAHGGQQFRVAPGDVVRVDRMAAEVGAAVRFEDVRMVADGATYKAGTGLTDRCVVATVLRQDKGQKVLVFKKKKRKQYRRTRGHRQHFTEVRIDGIE